VLAATLAMIGLWLGGASALALLAGSWESWSAAAAVGHGLAGFIGLASLFGASRALRAGRQAFLVVVVGGMLARLLLAGLAVGLVMGLTRLDPVGFVGGLMVGVVLFQMVEVGGLAASRRSAGESRQHAG
jgi:hypothetical protein